MRARRRCGPLALVVTTVLLTVACTGDDGTDRPTPTTTTVGGGTVRLGVGGDLVVDPIEASLTSPRDLMVIDLLHDGLTRLDGDGVPQPDLAADWEANDTFTAFRLRLDPKATFASGRAITPADVIASLERVIRADGASLAARALGPVTGFRAFVTGAADHLSGLSAPDAATVRVGLDAPLSVLPEILSSPLLSVVDVDTIAGDDRAALDLSGDWAVASAAHGGLRLERRAGAPGHLGAVELRRYDDDGAAYDGFEAGQVDWAAVPSSRYEDALHDHGDDAFAPFQAELLFGMNVDGPTLANAALREAITLAIDREAIVDAAFADLADPLSTVVPAGVVGHDPDRCPDCALDPERAAAIVRYAYHGQPPPTVHIDFDQSDPQRETAQRIADDLEAAGIPTQLRPLPLDDYEAFVVSGHQELFSLAWVGTYASPDAYLAPLFGSTANENLTGYESAAVDGLLSRARASDDRVKNAARWADAERRILEAWVVVPLAQFRTQVVVADRVEGLAHAVDGTVDWSRVRVSD